MCACSLEVCGILAGIRVSLHDSQVRDEVARGDPVPVLETFSTPFPDSSGTIPSGGTHLRRSARSQHVGNFRSAKASLVFIIGQQSSSDRRELGIRLGGIALGLVLVVAGIMAIGQGILGYSALQQTMVGADPC